MARRMSTVKASKTPTSAPSIARCIGMLVTKCGGADPNSNDICENLAALNKCDIGSGGMFVVTVADGSDGTMTSDKTFAEIAEAVESNKDVIAMYGGHYFNLIAFSNATGSQACVFNGLVADASTAIIHTLNILPTSITHTTTRLTVSS